MPEVPQCDAPGGAICLAGRHNLLETLRKDELHLGKLKKVHWKGGLWGGAEFTPLFQGWLTKTKAFLAERPCPRVGGLQHEEGSVCSDSRDIGPPLNRSQMLWGPQGAACELGHR